MARTVPDSLPKMTTVSPWTMNSSGLKEMMSSRFNMPSKNFVPSRVRCTRHERASIRSDVSPMGIGVDGFQQGVEIGDPEGGE